MSKIKIGIVGTHFSGKTTICHKLVAELKSLNYKADIVREAARYSYFYTSGIRNFEMQLDLLTRHVTEELDISRTNDIVVCDRTVIDILAYTNLLGNPICRNDTIFLKLIIDFSNLYLNTYDIIFWKSKYHSMSANTDNIRLDENFQILVYNYL